MRLIDADKLKEAIMMKEDVSEETWDELYDSVLDEIDNAPTVEVGYLTNCANCERVEKIRAKRPHGKWISQFDYSKQHNTVPSGYGNFWWCNKCGSSTEKQSNFCPNCGADMRDRW